MVYLKKQIIQIEHNRIKNPNWQGDNQLAIYNRGQGFELATTNNESSKWPEQLPDCKSHVLDTRHTASIKATACFS